MAAPLPEGSRLSILPQAPSIGDPRQYALDAQGALAAQQAGLMIGQELANIENQKAKRALEAEQIKLAMQKNKVDMMQLDELATVLPGTVTAAVQAQLAESKSRQATAALAGASATERMNQGLPAKVAAGEVQTAANLLASAKADAPTAGRPAAERAQLGAQAQAYGGALGGAFVAPGESMAPDSSIISAKRAQLEGIRTEPMREIDPKTGNTVVRLMTYDVLGNVIRKSDPITVEKLGADEKSVSQSMKELTGITQSIGLADTLKSELEAYAKSGKAGVGQAVASQMANAPATGPVSVVRKALGASLQNRETVAIVGAIQNLKNTISKELFGSALTKEESANLEGMMPTASDISDPERAIEKLNSVRSYLDSKLKPYRDRGVLQKSLIQGPAPAASAADFSDAPVGATRTINGLPYRVEIRNGVKGWARVR